MKRFKYYTIKRRITVWLNRHLLCAMLTIVIIAFVANFCLIFTPYDKDLRGSFGDQFGAVNALFSGLAFAGLIYTIILQRRDLKLQRLEMKEQTREFKKENDTLRIQRFENTFFNMLSQFQEVVNNLSFTYLNRDKERRLSANGRECFSIAFESAPHKSEIQDMSTMNTSGWYIGMRNIIKTFGKEGYMESFSPPYFDHYFRFIYRILKFVQTSPLVNDFDHEYEYTCMLRAMLSRYELVWLYYNGLSDYGSEKLKPLIERYAMLKNLRKELLANQHDDFGSYRPSAWQKIAPPNSYKNLVSQWNEE